MFPRLLVEVASGACFGAALYASGVSSPAVITAQMSLSNFHMLKAFLMASAVSSIVVYVANRTAHSPTSPRHAQNLGFFLYDGNVLGGAMIGLGMALTGACPGTVLVQAGSGVPGSVYTLLGGVLGGLGYVIATPALQRARERSCAQRQRALAADCGGSRSVLIDTPTPEKATIMEAFSVTQGALVCAWLAMCAVMLLAISASDPAAYQTRKAGLVTPLVGGVLIGMGQAITVWFTRHTVGCSKSYEDVGRYLQSFTRAGKLHGSSIRYLVTPAIAFAVGIVLASTMLGKTHPYQSSTSGQPKDLTTIAKKLLGGAGMAFGGRIAGGCTSGHGISGLVTFSFSSFISVAAMFGTGILTAAISA